MDIITRAKGPELITTSTPNERTKREFTAEAVYKDKIGIPTSRAQGCRKESRFSTKQGSGLRVHGHLHHTRIYGGHFKQKSYRAAPD